MAQPKRNLAYPEYALNYLREEHEVQNGAARVPRLMRALGAYYRWKGGRYWEWSDDEYEASLRSWLVQQGVVTLKDYHEIQAHVKSTLVLRSPGEMPRWVGTTAVMQRNSDRWVAFKNGILNLSGVLRGENPRLVPHTPEWFSTTVLPYDYLPEAKCPAWERALGEWFPQDETVVRFLQEFAGYMLVPETWLHAGLFLEGPGANGKSTFIEALQGMLGKENYSSLALDAFRGEYSLDVTIGKLGNFSPETDAGARLPLGTLKQFISGDAMTTNRKYQKHVTFKPTARLVVAWNERPIVKDTSDGFWRRVYLVSFQRQFLGSRADLNLGVKLQQELPGILNWAIQGYRRLLEQGGLTPCEAIAKSRENFRSQSDPVRTYILQHWAWTPGSEDAVDKQSVYEHYLDNRVDTESDPLPQERFFKELYRCLPGVEAGRRRDKGTGVRVSTVLGLTLKQQEQSSVEAH